MMDDFKTDTLQKRKKGKRPLLERPGLYTDYYELAMAQGYVLDGRAEETACFDYFFRKNPFEGGYVIFAGLADLFEILSNFTFHDEELQYLENEGFKPEFIDYLRNFELEVSVDSAREGEVIFPLEPVLRVTGPLPQVQLLETLILNILNFESLIATKAMRLKDAAGDRRVLDFGLRRAQGLGGISASRAAVIGGVEATSNVYSAHAYDLPASGTMAHSWIQSFEDELSAFRKFAELYPEDCVLLVDTYDTLESGVPNAIKVAKELEEKGHRLKGIRLDSGDLAYFAKKSRQQLDRAGLDYVKIAASNQLDERLIRSLLSQNAPIDLFGVGTRLVTGHESPALDGVYKLASVHGEPKLKLSENIEKVTLPGHKKVLRYINGNNKFYGDGILLEEEKDAKQIFHPYYPDRRFDTSGMDTEPLLHRIMEQGRLKMTARSAEESAAYARSRFAQLNPEHKRFENPHIYKVGISNRLMKLRDELRESAKK